MTCLYATTFFAIRRATAADCARLAQTLRAADRAELRASHPKLPFKTGLLRFCRASSPALAVMLRGELGALCGLVPTGEKAVCVWLLSSQAAEKYPKSFYAAVRACLHVVPKHYRILFNFADERYTAAHRLVTHLGGEIHPVFIRCGVTRFFLFTLRRNNMGGVIKPATTAVSSAVAALEKSRARARSSAREAEDVLEASSEARRAGEAEAAYLFESAAEKTRRLYAQVRRQAAQSRAQFAAGGITPSSATLDTLLKQNRLQAQLTHASLQDNLQRELGEREQVLEAQVRSLRGQYGALQARSRRKSTLGKWSDTFLSWFR